MKLTLIQPTDVPPPLREKFGPYDAMFHRMFAAEGFTFETVRLADGQLIDRLSAASSNLVSFSSSRSATCGATG